MGIFLYVLISLLDQLLVGLLAPGFIAMPLRGVPKKSGLASEPVTLDPEQLELNGQILRIPHIICVNLVYSSFFLALKLKEIH